MFVARIKDNPGVVINNVKVAATNLLRRNKIKQCTGFNLNIDLDTAFILSILDTDKVKLEELLMIVKYKS